MATLNDFKLINQYCNSYFEKLVIQRNASKINDSNKKRFGFYLLGLSLITGNNDFSELQNGIIDSDFCKYIYSKDNKDYGLDAYYIDEENHKIYLFNFKFRENFNPIKGGKQRPILDSLKFINMLRDGNFESVDEISKKAMTEINELLTSDTIWDITLYLVSNENVGASLDDPEIKSFRNLLGIEMQNIILDDFIGFLSKKPSSLKCSFILDSDSILTYEENSLSSSKSYLVKLDVATILRITSDDENLRNQIDLEDYSKLKNIKINNSILYDNVRGYLGDSKYNKNIVKTLSETPEKFFMFNNGITIVSKNVSSSPKNGNKKFLINLDGFQIVNGGQTLKSIYKFNFENFDESKIANASILVRIFKTENDTKLINEIAEYTNSQNAISAADLKSISDFQIKIEKSLEQNDIGYIRKIGDIGITKSFSKEISKEKLAQIIYSYNGYPDRATNQKSRLFDKYYDEIFDEEKLDFDNIYNLVNIYFDAEQEYRKKTSDVYTQKVLYIVYLKSKNYSVEDGIELIEKTIKEYRANENISDSRKLIQKGFKDLLDMNLKKQL